MTPPISKIALEVSLQVHTRMMHYGPMYSIFDARFKPTAPDDEGRVAPFSVGTIRLVDIIYRGEPVRNIPVFVRFFKRVVQPTECVVCTERYYDVDLGAPAGWKAICEDIDGDWMWKLLFFPVATKEVGCRHRFDVCKACIRLHLDTQLEQLGRAGCDRLSCPSEGCGRVYEYEEVKKLATPDTFGL